MSIMLTRLTLEGPENSADAATAAAWAVGAQGVELKDADTGYPAGRMCVVAWLGEAVDHAQVQQTTRALAPACTVTLSATSAHWQAALSETLEPVQLDRFLVVPHDAQIEATPLSVLRIEAGLAFGSGVHATTRLCAEALQNMVISGTVLDVGAGTGILAMIAMRLGAIACTLVEIDTAAFDSCRRNLTQNHIQGRIHRTLSDVKAPADLVVANLYRDPLMSLAPQLAQCTQAGGTLVISGFTQAIEHEVLARFLALGFMPSRTHSHGEWRAIVLTQNV